MREETSPPREPSPYRHHIHHQPQQQQQHQQLQSPCIQLIPSPSFSPPQAPAVVLSPSLAAPTSPSPQCLSPTTTLVPSPSSRCSPNLSASIDNISSPNFVNKLNGGRHSETSKQTSHSVKKKCVCECQNQNCPKCVKNQERNINNNLMNINNNVLGSPNTLSVSRTSSRGKLRQQSSSQGSFESLSNSPCLSRDSSCEQYTDTTGVDLEKFIPDTLNRNAKDRALMLRIEQELVNLAKDRCKTHFKFPPMSSYQRMLVHRCAAYFGMEHNIEPTGKSVIVNKTKCTRIPEVEFKDHVKEDIIFSEEPRRSILKRDSSSIEDYCFKSPDRCFSLESRRSKSFEEREEEYEKARRRIFNREVDKWWFLWQMQDGSSEDFGWSEMPWSSTESDCSSRFRLQPPEIHRRQTGKLIKGHSEEPGEATRPCVSKSFSFGGYGGTISVLSRGDSVMSTHSAGPRLLTKQGRIFLDSGASSVSWRLSPSSSGYKSQSQMSESVTPSPTSTPHLIMDARQNSNCSSENQDHQEIDDSGDNHVVWAVTDMQNVPRGSIIINPQTGKPLKNDDGTIYHYDPTNIPATICQMFGKAPPSPQRTQQPQSTSKENLSQSPKKTRSIRSSPASKSHLTNSSTSPIMPFSPTLVNSSGSQNRNFSYVTTENIASPPQQQHQQQQQFPGYSSTYSTPVTGDTTAVYQQPYIVYTAPYGVHVQPQFETRMEPTMVSELAGTYYMGEGCGAPPSQAITYQQAHQSYWNHPVYYPGNTASNTVSQRYPAQPGYIPTGYSQNFMPPPSSQLHQNPPDFVPVYHNQQMQVIYQTQPTPPSPVVYPNQQPQILYTQNPVYQTPTAYPPPPPPQISAYPQGTPTPNSCSSTASGQIYTGHSETQTYVQLAQSIQQLNLTGNGQAFLNPKGSHHTQFDYRQRGPNNSMKNKQFGKNFALGSSQSSTGTNSPAATVIASYCPTPNQQLMYRPPETPPNQFAYPPNFNVPSVMYKPMGNVRASTPGTSRSSRSPTPAGEVQFFDRQRMPIPPPAVYQGMPYVAPVPDPRLIPGRGQPSMNRQAALHTVQPTGNCFLPATDNRSRNKRGKGKTNRQSGLPPSGR
nr:cAMP-regulated phosphoprotein 21 [Leptinotarsa decemlineata]